MREMFEMFCDKSEHKRIVIAGNSCICKVAIHAVALILCLLFAIASPQDFHFVNVGLELSDIEHLVSSLTVLIVLHTLRPFARGVVPLSQLVGTLGGSTPVLLCDKGAHALLLFCR